MPNDLQTKYYRGRDGWNGKSTLSLEENRCLTIQTYKEVSGGGTLLTRASVMTDDGGGSMSFILSYGTHGDYSRTVRRCTVARVTENVVRKYHEDSLKLLDSILEDVRRHYAEQQREREAEAERTRQREEMRHETAA